MIISAGRTETALFRMLRIDVSLRLFGRNNKILDMKKNRLQDCPDRVGTLSRLKRLELDGEIRRGG